MEKWQEKLLLDLNSISRVAVLEQAYQVETMLRNYTKILKYHWTYDEKNITANMELIHLQMLLEYYQVKWGSQLTFEIETMTGIDTKDFLIPHFSFCGTVMNCLEVLQADAPIIKVKSLVSMVENEVLVTMFFGGEIDVNWLKQTIVENKVVGYDTFERIRKRWEEMFGKKRLILNIEKEELKIQFMITGVASK